MKAKKLPSGSWRCRVYDYTDENGKKHYKSFTCTNPNAKGKLECEKMANDYLLSKVDKRRTGNKQANVNVITLEEAWNSFIAKRSNVYSPRTVKEYKGALQHSFTSLHAKNIYDITQEDIQSEINIMASKNSPKTVKNKNGYLSAIMKEYRPDFVYRVKLPQKVKPILYIPNDDEVKKILDACNDDEDMRIAILLGAFGPLRRSEICALKVTDIYDTVCHIHSAMVLDENKNWVIKTTKSVAGDRYIPLPDFVLAEIRHKKDRVVDLHPNNITDRFQAILKRAGVPHFRFHDLRHYCASMLHAMNIPQQYIMDRVGHSSLEAMQIYRHAMKKQTDSFNARANEYFESNFKGDKTDKQK